MGNVTFSYPHDADHDVFREALAYSEATTGFPAILIGKDYYCSLVLQHFFDRDTSLVFKGGTCLAKVYAGFYRLSEDIDLIIPAATDTSRDQRRAEIEPVKQLFTKLPTEVPGAAISEILTGHNESRQYIGYLEYPSSVIDRQERIKIEIGIREPLLSPAIPKTAHTIIANPFSKQSLIPAGCFAVPFNISRLSDKDAGEVIRAAMDFRFEIEEVNKFAKENGLPCITQETPIGKPLDHPGGLPPKIKQTEVAEQELPPIDPEEFVRSLTFSVENDLEISIKEPEKKVIIMTKAHLNVRNNTWQILRSMVHDGYYRIPHKGTSKDYGTIHKTLSRISEKIVRFLNDQLDVSIPETFPVIINDKHNKVPNRFSPIFNTGDDSRNKSEHDHYTDEKLLEEFYSKAKTYMSFQGTKDIGEFAELSKAVIERKLLTDRQIEDAIRHETDAKTIEDEFKSDRDPFDPGMEITEKP